MNAWPDLQFDRALLPDDLGMWIARPHGRVRAWLTAGHLWVDVQALHSSLATCDRIPLVELRWWWRNRVAELIRDLRLHLED